MEEMTVAEAAGYLKNSRDYVRVLIMRGKLRRSRQCDGRTYFIDRASVLAFDQARREKQGRKIRSRSCLRKIEETIV